MPKRKLITRRNFFCLTGAGLLGGLATVGYTFYIEPFWYRVQHKRLKLKNLPTSWHGKKVIQLSDLHANGPVPTDYLVKAIEHVAALKPDVILMTGDLTDYAHHENKVCRLIYEKIPATPLGTYAVFGNHDYGHGWKDIQKADKLEYDLRKTEVTFLRDEAKIIDGLQLIGLDDKWCPRYSPQKVLKNADRELPTLVMAHNPDTSDEDIWDDIECYTLSGHTHGGQCKPPFLPPPLLPVKNRNYTRGEYQVTTKRKLYINSGLGFVRQMRFNVRPEITVFTLT